VVVLDNIDDDDCNGAMDSDYEGDNGDGAMDDYDDGDEQKSPHIFHFFLYYYILLKLYYYHFFVFFISYQLIKVVYLIQQN
jgi:hypothetical protein